MKNQNPLLTKLRTFLLISYLCLLFMHFVIKDRIYPISVLYYATPLHLLIIFGLVLALLFYKQKRVLIGLLLLTGTMSFYFSKHYFGTPIKIDSTATTTKILLWNVAKNKPLPTDVLIRHIRESGAKIVALVEAEHVSKQDKQNLEAALPNFQFKTLYGKMLVAVKGTIEKVTFEDEALVYKFNYIHATIDQQPISIMIVDVYAGPMLNKQIPLGIILDFTRKNTVNILLGDFNTPLESIYFDDFRTKFKSFHHYSNGLTSTWPLPIPMIEIDQIWLDRELQPLELQKYCYGVSDHKLLIAEFR